MADDKNNIEIRSGEVQEILGGVPPLIVRLGILLFLFVIFLVILFSFIFRYPDVITSDMIVTSEYPPATLVARTNGKIVQLNVVDNEKVKKGQLIALVENPANYTDLFTLQHFIDSVQPAYDTLNYNLPVRFNKNLQLGTLQENYSLFLAKNDELKQFYSKEHYRLKIEALDNQIMNSTLLYNRIYDQKQSVEQEFKIKERQFKRQQTLIEKSVSSNAELEKAEEEMLSKKSELDGLRSQLAQELINKGELIQRKIETIKEFEDAKIRFETELLQAFNNLKSEISNWELTYLLRSPIDGTVSFNQFYSENQNVSVGDRVFTIVPEQEGELIGKVQLPIRGSGKVQIGQDVNVKFDNYSYLEYGIVRGKVKNKSTVPEDSFYMVEIEFPEGLVTNYGNTLEMQNQLKGQAEIITEDLRLVQRVFNPLKALWKERVKQ